MKENSIKKIISDYYSAKILTHGANSKGVDWNGKESHYLRFTQLSNIISSDDFSILDYGCGYGEYLNFLIERNYQFNYCGYDISPDMIDAAINAFPDYKEKFTTHIRNDEHYDYTVGNGIFSVKNSISDNEWKDYIISELNLMNKISRKGFSFNALTKYSDKEMMKDYLYYADPLFLFDYCKKNFSKNVALMHDYGLYEFTISVKLN